jgi:signal transduction histidine kinase
MAPRKKRKPDTLRALKRRLSEGHRFSTLGGLVPGVAHELNNPLSVIIGFSQNLVRTSAANASAAAFLQMIHQEALRCQRLIHIFRTLARLPPPDKRPDDLPSALQDLLPLLEAQARICRAKVVTEFPSTLPAITIDRSRLLHAVTNLCLNALDAMPHGGTLTLKLSLERGPKNVPSIVIHVQDTGPGILSAVQKKLFNPFFSTKELGRGLGMGLLFVRDVAREHGGTLSLKSEAGKGTTFSLRLPAQEVGRSSGVP